MQVKNVGILYHCSAVLIDLLLFFRMLTHPDTVLRFSEAKMMRNVLDCFKPSAF
jgi:hypothetical protein